MKYEPILRSVASGLLIFLVTKALTIGAESSKKLDRVEMKVDTLDMRITDAKNEVNLRLDRQRGKIDDLDTRIRICEIKQGDSSHGRN